MAATVGFEKIIKPYFTACYRAHMIEVLGPSFDLWSYDSVKSNFGEIEGAVSGGSMPKEGCPEGVWEPKTRKQFLADFEAWKAGGYQP